MTETTPHQPFRPSRRLLVGLALLLVLDVATMLGLARLGWWHLFVLVPAFLALAWTYRRDVGGLGVWGIVGVAALVQLPGLFADPQTSDDVYRYVWDGRVQLAGINPYAFPPADPALAELRDPILFPPGEPTEINRPGVRTIYPPVAQVWFVALAAGTPWWLGTLGAQIAAAAAVVATTGFLARALGERRHLALLYGGCPVVMVEAANSGHLDAVLTLALLGALQAVHRGRFWLAGVCLAVAAGLKLVPLLLVPALLRRGRWRTSLVGAVGLAASYLPHVLVVGVLVAGFLPGYLAEEGYAIGGADQPSNGASRFALLLWLPESARTVVALVAAVVLAGLAVLRSGREPVALTCCWLYGSALLLASPVYPWYALPLAMLAVLAGRLEWLGVWAAAYAAFVLDDFPVGVAAAYGAGVLVVVLAGWRRFRAGGRAAVDRRLESNTCQPRETTSDATALDASGEPRLG